MQAFFIEPGREGLPMLVDSHCHLDRLDLSPYEGSLDRAIQAARDRGVGAFLCVGIGRGNAAEVLKIARQYPDIHASVGLHPLEFSSSDYNPEPETMAAEQIGQWLRQEAADENVVAIGETGLDYYYSSDSRVAQQESFVAHLELARELSKPVVVHSRDAREDTIALIRNHGCQNSAGVLHCFTENWEMARQALDLGYYISFSGIITFKNAANLREIAAKVPENRLLVETDSPYLAPVPYRGKKNEPKYVHEVAECIAGLRGVSFQHLARVTGENFRRLFGL